MIISTAVVPLKTQALPPSLVPIVRFSILTAVAALSSGAFAALRATEVVKLLDDLRRESSPLVRTSTLLDLENSRLLIRLRGPWSDIVTGLTSLTLDTKAAERTIKTRQSSSRSERYTGLDAVDISDAFHDYVISQIDLPTYLLEIAAVVRGDRNLGNTLAPLLNDYRDAVDDLTDTLADRVDDIAKRSIKDDGKVLDDALKAAYDTYRNVRDGLSISLGLSLGLGRGRYSNDGPAVEEKVEGAVLAETPATEKTETAEVKVEEPEKVDVAKVEEKVEEKPEKTEMVKGVTEVEEKPEVQTTGKSEEKEEEKAEEKPTEEKPEVSEKKVARAFTA